MKKYSWVDRNEYPFKSNYVNIGGNEMHYIDEGKGETILFVHGIPDWSFGWRNVIKELSEHYRCIAPDHLGFGLSDKTAAVDLTIKGHAQRLTGFIERLELKNIHLVVHDFGGPIGFTYAIEHAESIKSITLFNTWMWPLNGIKHFDSGGKVVHSWLGKILYLKFNFSVRFMLRNSYADKKNLPANVYNHYLKAQEEPNARLATYTLGKGLTGEEIHMQYLWSKRRNLNDIPMQILWGMKDKFVPAELLLSKWTSTFLKAKFIEVNSAGHFVQEEAPHELSKAISNLVHTAKVKVSLV